MAREEKGRRRCGWIKPNVGWTKVNCDVAFKESEKGELGDEAGIGVIIRNEEGRVIEGDAKKF